MKTARRRCAGPFRFHPHKVQNALLVTRRERPESVP